MVSFKGLPRDEAKQLNVRHLGFAAQIGFVNQILEKQGKLSFSFMFT